MCEKPKVKIISIIKDFYEQKEKKKNSKDNNNVPMS